MPSINESIIRRLAQQIGVSPSVAVALWDQESSRGKLTRNRDAGRYGQIRGPFQVSDAAFKEVYPEGDVDNEVDNAIAGLSYLKKWIDRTGGDVKAALEAYHSGSPGSTKKDSEGREIFKKDSLGKLTGSYAEDVLRKARDIDGSNEFDARDYKAQTKQVDVFNSNDISPVATVEPTVDFTALADPHAYLASDEMRNLLSQYYDDVIGELA